MAVRLFLAAALLLLPTLGLVPAPAAPADEASASVPTSWLVCERCRYGNEPDWKYCLACGQSLAASAERRRQETSAEMLARAAGAVFRVQSVRIEEKEITGRKKKGRQVMAPDVRFALGSGVLVDDQGTLVTSIHALVTGGQSQVVAADGSFHPVELVAMDGHTELAVLRMEPGLAEPLAPCSPDAEPVIGQPAWFISFPIASRSDGTTDLLPQAIRETSISALHAGGLERLAVEDLALFDAEMGVASGGGALVDARGCLLGVGNEPLGRPQSSATLWNPTAAAAVASLREGEAPERGYLGLGLRRVTDYLQQRYGLESHTGVVVDFVIPGSPAAEAGLRRGDMVQSVAGQAVNDPIHLLQERMPRPGQGLDLVIGRDGRSYRVHVVAGSRPVAPRLDIYDEVEQWMQVTFRAVEHGGTYQTGLHIEMIRPGSPATDQVAVGDILQKVNDRWVNSPEAFSQEAGANPSRLLLQFRRPGVTKPFYLRYKREYSRSRRPLVY